MSGRSPRATWAWLRTNPTADELREAFPEEWAAVRARLGEVVEHDDPATIAAFVASVAKVDPGRRVHGTDPALSAEIRRQIAVRLLRRMNESLRTGVANGTVRFNLVNGWIVQRLFFRKGLERKPVSMRWYRVVWPRLPQRRFLMPLVDAKGIYCFYGRPLVEALAELAGGRPVLEIAAGDGTLARFLRDEGVDVVATDDHRWSDHVQFGDDVVREDAVHALRTRRPRVVICSWPPAGNTFEREVFRTSSVETYVVIGSRDDAAAGDPAAYRRARGFTMVERDDLARCVLPEELRPRVRVFTRDSATIDLTGEIDLTGAPAKARSLDDR